MDYGLCVFQEGLDANPLSSKCSGQSRLFQNIKNEFVID